MPEYLVEWQIEIVAETPEEAARKALIIQRDTTSLATAFDVTDDAGDTARIDLEAIPMPPL
jgi:hypothetical protein